MLLKLKSIEEEAADCRAAFAGVPVGALALHVHHDVLVEALTHSPETRITFILTHKNLGERALRLRLFRPIPVKHITLNLAKARAEWDKARAEWDKAGHHAAVCPDCPWDGKTIFPAAKGGA